MNVWNVGRGEGILGLLVDKADNGCLVRIVVAAKVGIVEQNKLPADPPDLFFAHCTGGEGIDGAAEAPDADSGVDTTKFGAIPRVHSKYLLIGGTFNDTAGARMVFTGSSTITDRSLRGGNDNTWVNLKGPVGDPKLYGAYQDNFSAMFANTPPC